LKIEWAQKSNEDYLSGIFVDKQELEVELKNW